MVLLNYHMEFLHKEEDCIITYINCGCSYWNYNVVMETFIAVAMTPIISASK